MFQTFQVFRDFVSKLEEAVEEQKGIKIKSATASATEPVAYSSTENTSASNEWLAGTNALKTEKVMKTVCTNFELRNCKTACTVRM